MGFWWFMVVCSLLFPITMIFYGIRYSKGAPQYLKSPSGYRTALSMKNEEMWKYAHKHLSKYYLYVGIIIGILAIVVDLCIINLDNDSIGWIVTVVVVIQFIAFFMSTLPTHNALKKNFDENGRYIGNDN